MVSIACLAAYGCEFEQEEAALDRTQFKLHVHAQDFRVVE
jgi:hypothetical protein